MKTASFSPEESLTEKAYQHLLGLIVDGHFVVGERLPTSVDLAEEIGVSRAPVQKALARLVDEGIASQEKHKGFFVKSTMAKAGMRRGTIIVISSGVELKFAGSADIAPTFGLWDFGEIKECAARYGYRVETYNLRQRTLSFPSDSKGIISLVSKAELAAVAMPTVPIVYLGVEDFRSIPSFTGDVRLGVYMLTQHLFTLGHRSISLCGPHFWDDQLYAEAYHGYVKAYQEIGEQPFHTQSDIYRLNRDNPEEIRDYLLKHATRSTALISTDIELSNEFFKLSRLFSVAIPTDLSLASLLTGATGAASANMFTGLTYNWDDIVEACYEAINDPHKRETISKCVFKPQLVVGNTAARLRENAKK